MVDIWDVIISIMCGAVYVVVIGGICLCDEECPLHRCIRRLAGGPAPAPPRAAPAPPPILEGILIEMRDGSLVAGIRTFSAAQDRSFSGALAANDADDAGTPDIDEETADS